jgi:DEAD/DEAH box helicase domain-containing protein
MGISGLYAHQSRAIDRIRNREHTVVATPTASGKSLIYNLPVLERILHNPQSKSLYLFPLKALGQDQLRVLEQDIIRRIPDLDVRGAIYDGDTPTRMRSRIKAHPPHILLSNPEMLHLGILPYHQQWHSFLSDLDFVVVDEVHTYRGVMGANMAWVFRRLQRICGFYGASPTFVFSSATVGNPGELTRNLTGLNTAAITENGAPQGPKHIIFLNPALEGAARSALLLLQAALARNLRTIVYCQSRKMTELIAMWTSQRMASYAPYISAYRSGFLPEERREIEAKLSRGDLLAVISTSALELGIDIGELDLCLLVGYPGSVMATWQRGGRVGRQQQESAVVLIGHEDSLDQYFMHHPQEFFRLEPETAVVNPHNPVIMKRHLQCAAADLPLRAEESLLQPQEAKQAVQELLDSGELLRSAGGEELHAANSRIHQEVNLRGAGHTLSIEDVSRQRSIGQIDLYRAYHETHPGAVYLHRGRTYLVEDLDLENRRVLSRPAKTSYFTRVRTDKHTDILSVEQQQRMGDVLISRGRLRVTDSVTGFERRRVKGQTLITVVPLDLPPLTFETEGMWIEIPPRIKDRIETARLHFMGGLHALEHVLIATMPLLVLTDRNDLGGIAQPAHPQLRSGAVFIFDGIPGGVGLTRQAFERARRLLQQGLQALASCGCMSGCPLCVHSPKCGSGNRPLDKAAARGMLEEILQLPAALQKPAQAAPVRPAASPQRQSRPGSARPAASQGNGVRYGVLDLETQLSAEEVGGWHNAELMKISCAVLFDSREEEYLCFAEEEVEGLIERLQQLDLVVGFNIKRFDYKVLQGYSHAALAELPTLDLLQEVHRRLGYRLSLNQLARSTLGEPKSGNGMQALTWWRRGEIDKIKAYCRDDVRITRELYRFGRQNGYLLFTNKAKKLVRLEVDWP